jgi:hypothetical protein
MNGTERGTASSRFKVKIKGTKTRMAMLAAFAIFSRSTVEA